MTPKEKAEELFNKFAQTIPHSSYLAYEGGVQINFDLENAKRCALIAVDEIIQSIRFTDAKSDFGYVGYWQEVKQEIELL